MKISIVTSYFLPVPPLQGGAMEKTWWAIAQAWATSGHQVTVLARTWPGQPAEEICKGVRFLRIPGANLSRSRVRNLLADFRWSRRVWSRLPPGDFVISNSVFLPVWFSRRPGKIGRVVPVIARMPKGQLRLYGSIELLLALSTAVAERIRQATPRYSAVTEIFPLPIDVARLSAARKPQRRAAVRIGYMGRLHPEKGIELLLQAAALLAGESLATEWELYVAGPVAVSAGGGGEIWWRSLEENFSQKLSSRLVVAAPEFDPGALAARYGEIDLFCYPSVAEQGETFGVAVAEAMAAGCVPVVSSLECFRDLVRDGENGRRFEHASPVAAQNLAAVLRQLLNDAEQRSALARAAVQEVQLLDYKNAAARLAAILQARLTALSVSPTR